MSVLNILVYVALIGYVMFKRVQGQPVATPRRLFALPIILIILGYGDVVLAVVGLSVTIGLIVLSVHHWPGRRRSFARDRFSRRQTARGLVRFALRTRQRRSGRSRKHVRRRHMPRGG